MITAEKIISNELTLTGCYHTCGERHYDNCGEKYVESINLIKRCYDTCGDKYLESINLKAIL